MALRRPQTLPSRAWSATSLQAGVEHCATMSGLHRSKPSREELMRRLQVRSVQNHGLYSRDPQGKFQIERIRIRLIYTKDPKCSNPKAALYRFH